MTSSGYRSHARIPAGFGILIFTAALVLPQVRARAASTFGSSTPSARIQALGSTFAWTIPDMLTDITLNPARAWDAESLTFNYGLRNPNASALPFPVASYNSEPDFFNMDISRTNEIRIFGARALGWKWAMEAEWKLHHDDGCNQSEINPFSRSSGGDIRVEMRENCDIDDDNYARFDIASARRLGDRTVLGLRAGGTYRYDSRKMRDRTVSDVYEYDSDTGGYVPDYGRSRDRMRDSAEKLFAGYLEAGMTWKESGELVVRGGYAKGTFLTNDYDLLIDTRYDNYTGEINDYNYCLIEPREERDGESWLLSVSAKKRYQGGLIIAATGRHERGSFESDWGENFTQYSWGTHSALQIEDRFRIIGEGERSRSEAVFSIGKTYALEQRIDLTPGAHVLYRRKKFNEEGQAYISSLINENGGMSSLRSDFPVMFERTLSRTRLTLPIAIEFRAASFFHIYSGFGVNFTWTRDSEKNSLLLDQGGLDDQYFPDEMETDGNAFDSSYRATLGFSLRYREKLFFDMYTKSSIFPGDITYYYYAFDLRYVF